MPIPQLASKISAVAVYSEGAIVTRSAELAAGAEGWPAQVSLGGLPLCLDDGSLRVRVEGANAPQATAVRTALEVPVPDSTQPPAENEELKAAQRALDLLRSRSVQVKVEAARIANLKADVRPEARKGDAPPPSSLGARLELLEFRTAELERLAREEFALESETREAERKLADVQERHDRATTVRQPRDHELRKSAIVTLSAPGGVASGRARLWLDYFIPGACWVPAYTLRFNRELTRAALSLRALVCQQSGEDWDGVALTLSTAFRQRWLELPEWQSVRIGRKQASTPKRGWRPAPAGAEELFADFDKSVADDLDLLSTKGASRRAKPDETSFALPSVVGVAFSESPAAGGAAGESIKCDSGVEGAAIVVADNVRWLAGRGLSAPGAPPPIPKAQPAPAPKVMAAPAVSRVNKPAVSAMRRMAPEQAPAVEPPPPPDDLNLQEAVLINEGELALSVNIELLNFGALKLSGILEDDRGHLKPSEPHERYLELLQAQKISLNIDLHAALNKAVLVAQGAYGLPPNKCRFPVALDGFDHAYTGEGPVRIPSDGHFNNVPLLTRESDAKARFVCVPREAPEVFRFAEFLNPLGAPLLQGPLDVWIGEDFLLATRLLDTPEGAFVSLGLGVEQGLKAARNTRFEEETSGLLGGTLNLKHELHVELLSHLPVSADIEVRERLPVTREKEDQIKLLPGKIEPAWQPYAPAPGTPEQDLKGGYAWRVTLEPGKSRKLSASYTIQIAAKQELAGGNRRE